MARTEHLTVDEYKQYASKKANHPEASNRTPKAWFIVSVGKSIGLDLSFSTKEEAEATLADDVLYTTRQRKSRRVVPYFKIDGKEYLEIDDVMCRIG